jgi:hypothetical protein
MLINKSCEQLLYAVHSVQHLPWTQSEYTNSSWSGIILMSLCYVSVDFSQESVGGLSIFSSVLCVYFMYLLFIFISGSSS